MATKFKIKKNSENAHVTFGKITWVMLEENKTQDEILAYMKELQTMSYDEWTEKVNQDFKGKIEIK